MSLRWSTDVEAAGEAPSTPPPDGDWYQPGEPLSPGAGLFAASVDSAASKVVWDTQGVYVHPTYKHTVYSAQVMAEDGKSKAPVDFMIDIGPVEPPYWVTPPSPCGETVKIAENQTSTFTVRAAHDDANALVRMFLSPTTPLWELPGSPSLSIGAPGNPVDGVFSWLPPPGSGGKQYPLTFNAYTSTGWAEPCTVTLDVGYAPVPLFDCITSDPYLRVEFIDGGSYDPDGSIASWSWTLGDGATATGQGPFAHDYASKGWYDVTLTLTDASGLVGSLTKPCFADLNRPPVLDGIAAQSVYEGMTVNFPVTATDPDGDALVFVMMPGIGSFVDAGGSGSFTWPTSSSDVGVYTVTFGVTDGEFWDWTDAAIEVLEVPPGEQPAAQDSDRDGIPDEQDDCNLGPGETCTEPLGAEQDESKPSALESDSWEGSCLDGLPTDVGAAAGPGGITITWRPACPVRSFLVWNGTELLVEVAFVEGRPRYVALDRDPWLEPHAYEVQARPHGAPATYEASLAVTTNTIDLRHCIGEDKQQCLATLAPRPADGPTESQKAPTAAGHAPSWWPIWLGATAALGAVALALWRRA